MSELLLECKDLSFSYHTPDGEIPVISHMNFDIYKGEFVSIVGPSGCGKSTLLNLLTNTLLPEDGSICMYGNFDAKNAFGYMLQQDHLFEWYDIWKNICIGPQINHCLSPECEEYLLKLLDRYGLTAFIHKKPSELSGGMRQRAAIIRTLAMKPELLYLDEPFSSLDYQNRLNAADDIGQIIRNEGKTAVLVTHDIGEAISLSTRILVLTKRPTTIKKEFILPFRDQGLTPLEIRNNNKFGGYFNDIWKELNKP
ncbi:MAG: ATP-binding cassette domain-containing protein [Lachnospiraceae bacterium]|nr:ATP-binding cassette domain-containing protein [Lachnospiraceae bacterium]